MRRLAFIVAALPLLACGADTSGPSRPEVAGTYVLTQLAFDPQGVLPRIDLLPRLGGDVPQLVLAPGGEAQLVFQDPATGLITVANGAFSTPQGGVRIDFGATPVYQAVLLSRRMTFAGRPDGSLEFDGPAPDGVVRQRLLQLVPEWSGEQLLDPVPGQLSVGFMRVP